jgi:hypothetical protein
VNLTQMHQAVSAAHAEALTESANRVEGLDGASCGPHLKHLAQLAAVAAAEGISADAWRAAILDEVGPAAATAVDSAETCMRQSGLWPWRT